MNIILCTAWHISNKSYKMRPLTYNSRGALLLTFNWGDNGLWDGDCEPCEVKGQSAGVDATVLRFHSSQHEPCHIRVGELAITSLYACTVLKMKPKQLTNQIGCNIILSFIVCVSVSVKGHHKQENVLFSFQQIFWLSSLKSCVKVLFASYGLMCFYILHYTQHVVINVTVIEENS